MRTFSVSPVGLDLIKTFEGFRAEPVALHDGGWVVGYGHVRIAEAGDAIAEDVAAELLKLDLAPVERFVNSVVTAPITQSQFDALVSFAFSIGQTAFDKSDVLRKVNAGQFVPAACAMDAWRKSSIDGESQVFDLLIRRRAAEKALFLKEPPAEGVPSVYFRAELDHAAAILGAPVQYGEIPAIGSAPRAKVEELPLAAKLTEIFKSEPATTLVLTQVVEAEEIGEGEIVTANARPVARKTGKNAELRAITMVTAEPPKKTGYRMMFGKPAETIGLLALALFGAGLIGLAGVTMSGAGAQPADVFGGVALAVPGLIATIAAAYGLWKGPTLARAAA